MIDPKPQTTSDRLICEILESVRIIAVVGISANTDRPSYGVSQFLQRRGYRIVPVNPGLAGQELLGEKVYASLADVPGTVDMVDIFRASDAAGEVAREAIRLAPAKGIKAIWMQLGVRHDAAAVEAEAAGLRVVMDRCPKIEFARLGIGQR